MIVLDRGRVVGAGPLATLLRDCPEMRRLWREELWEEADATPPVATGPVATGARVLPRADEDPRAAAEELPAGLDRP